MLALAESVDTAEKLEGTLEGTLDEREEALTSSWWEVLEGPKECTLV